MFMSILTCTNISSSGSGFFDLHQLDYTGITSAHEHRGLCIPASRQDGNAQNAKACKETVKKVFLKKKNTGVEGK